MASIAEVIGQLGGEQEVAYTAYRQVELMVVKANAPGKEAERAQVAAELAGQLWALTDAKKDDQGKDVPRRPIHPVATRIKILRLLQGVAGDKEVPAIAKALDDLELREDARCTLDRISSHEADQALVNALETAVGSEFRVGIVASLAARPNAFVMAALQKATADCDREVALTAVEALANFPEPANDEFIAKAAQCPCPVARRRASRARVRFAENLARLGAEFAARKVYQSIAAGDAEAPQKKAAEMALKAL
jgi:hypothetical protein